MPPVSNIKQSNVNLDKFNQRLQTHNATQIQEQIKTNPNLLPLIQHVVEFLNRGNSTHAEALAHIFMGVSNTNLSEAKKSLANYIKNNNTSNVSDVLLKELDDIDQNGSLQGAFHEVFQTHRYNSGLTGMLFGNPEDSEKTIAKFQKLIDVTIDERSKYFNANSATHKTYDFNSNASKWRNASGEAFYYNNNGKKLESHQKVTQNNSGKKQSTNLLGRGNFAESSTQKGNCQDTVKRKIYRNIAEEQIQRTISVFTKLDELLPEMNKISPGIGQRLVKELYLYEDKSVMPYIHGQTLKAIKKDNPEKLHTAEFKQAMKQHIKDMEVLHQNEFTLPDRRDENLIFDGKQIISIDLDMINRPASLSKKTKQDNLLEILASCATPDKTYDQIKREAERFMRQSPHSTYSEIYNHVFNPRTPETRGL